MAQAARLIATLLATSTLAAGCSSEPTDNAGSQGASAQPEALAGACEQYLETYNEISGRAMDHFYKLYRAAGQSEASIETARDHWRFVGGTIEKAMLADEWASLTAWHRNLQDHLHSIAVLSGENQYDFPEDAEAAVQMSERLEAGYVRCKFLRSLEENSAEQA